MSSTPALPTNPLVEKSDSGEKEKPSQCQVFVDLVRETYQSEMEENPFVVFSNGSGGNDMYVQRYGLLSEEHELGRLEFVVLNEDGMGILTLTGPNSDLRRLRNFNTIASPPIDQVEELFKRLKDPNFDPRDIPEDGYSIDSSVADLTFKTVPGSKTDMDHLATVLEALLNKPKGVDTFPNPTDIYNLKEILGAKKNLGNRFFNSLFKQRTKLFSCYFLFFHK